MIDPAPDGVILRVRVIPRAGRTTLAGTRDDAILVRLAAPPAEGAANAALVALLARALEVPRRAVTIVGGEHSRAKRVRVVGITADAVRRKLAIH